MVTIEQAMTAKNFEHVSLTNRDKTPTRARRMGKTKTWKTHPERFVIPVKHGLRYSFYITNFCYKDYAPNSSEWNVKD